MADGDRELVERCIQGDARAWSEFVRRTVRLVVHVVRGTLGSDRDVEDVTEDFYAHLVEDDYRALRLLREPYNLTAWLAIGARRRALNHLRARAARPMAALDDAALARLAGLDEAVTPDEREDIRAAVREAPLTPRERLVVTLMFFRDRSYAEIAQILSMPENSIGPTVRRALEKIREALQRRGWTR